MSFESGRSFTYRAINVRRRPVAWLTLSVLLALSPATAARSQAPAPFAPDEVIPFDRNVRQGTLANGVTFMIRRNDQPAKRAALRLAVKAGSLDEADDQQGLAHFLEHMAFNGSAHFKPGELVSYFETAGARLGPHVNAYTSFEETVYMLELPTDSSELLNRGVIALADFAGGLTLDPEQVDKERGVVIEEWRGRLGAGSRIRDKQIPVLYSRSRYAERLPIGKPEILRSAPAERLRAFYDTFYRPDRLAVIIVGDIDAEQVERWVREAFGPLKARAAEQPRPDASVPINPELLVSVVTDPEVTQSSVQLLTKRPGEPDRLVRDYRRSVVDRLADRMFNDRLGEITRRPDAPFLGAGAGGGALTPAVETFTLSARVTEGGIPTGLAAVATEARRVQQFGFTASELARAKRSLLSFYERAYNERTKTESGSYAGEYVAYFLEDEPSPGIAYEYDLVKQAMPGITLDEVTARFRTRLGSPSRVVLATAPDKPDVKPPTEEEIRQALRTAEAATVTAWTDETSATELLAKKPTAGTVTSRRQLAELGVTVVRLSNGVDVWLKPTDFKNDQVIFSLYASGGTSLASPDDFFDASLATSHIGLSGAGGIKATDLEKLLAGKRASASPYISLSSHGFNGSASPAELETALQLLYIQFTAPGDDPQAFDLLQRQLTSMVANRGRNPSEVFGERIDQLNTSNHYTSRPLTPEAVAALNRSTMVDFYRARFSNAADFTMFIVGAFDVDTVLPLVAQYVGSLPSTGVRVSKYEPLGITFPKGVERATVEKGQEPRSQTVMSFFADPSPDPLEQERIGAAATVLETALRDMLREELGQTYTVNVGVSQQLPQRGDGHVQISFGAAPENIQAMTERVLAEVKRLQQEGPTADLTTRAKESARRGYETALKQNSYWLRRLQSIHMLGGDPGDILTRTSRIDSLTPAVLRDTFQRFLPLDRYTVVTLLPARTP
ncbi:MAG: M16 family metallopeptidase [Vicinamibacterales bacterium]